MVTSLFVIQIPILEKILRTVLVYALIIVLFRLTGKRGLPVLIDAAVEVGPTAGDLDVGLVDEPPIVYRVTRRAGGTNELGGEGLHPPIDRDMIDLDAALGQQLFHVAVDRP